MGSKGAIGADGAEDDEGAEGFVGAEEDEGAAIYTRGHKKRPVLPTE